jgi:hypothetical protein
MAKWVDSDVLDLGINRIKTNANKMVLLKAYAAGDNYATVNGTNNIAEVAMATGDFALGAGAASARTLTTTAKTGVTATAGSGASPDLHIAFVDTVASKVLWVTDETTNQVVTSGNTVNFPALVYTSNQPT